VGLLTKEGTDIKFVGSVKQITIESDSLLDEVSRLPRAEFVTLNEHIAESLGLKSYLASWQDSLEVIYLSGNMYDLQT